MTSTLDVIINDPLKFLKAFPVKIGTVGASRVEEHVTYGQKRQASGPPVLFFFNGPTQYDDQAKVEFCRAHIVKAVRGPAEFYTLTDDCSFMITTELSGCCVVLDRTAASPRIAHVWPGQGEDGAVIQDQLAGLHATCKLYGKRNYVEPYSYVIGVNRGGWRFFAQERPGGRGIRQASEILL